MNYNKDIMDWTEFPAYDMIWTDPPWEERMVKLFHTMMRKDGYNPPVNTFVDIINQFAKLSDRSKPIVVEYGMKGYEKVIAIMKSKGHTHYKTIKGIQSMGRPFVLMTFNADIDVNVTRKGGAIIVDTLMARNEHTIFDPFAGIGFTAKAVRSAGKHYIGSELNPKRFAQLQKVNT